MAESKDPNAGPTDWAGLVTFSGGLFLLIFALVRGNPEGWGSPLIVCFLIGAAALLVAFVIVEARVAYPMFDLALFRVPTFGGACIAAFALSASLFSMFLYLTLYLQNGLGFSPLQAGLRFLPLSLLSFVVAPLAGRLSARVPMRALMGGGMLLVTIALLLMRGLNASSDWTALLAGFCLAGIGTAFVNPSLASTAVSVVPPQRAGMGSGINSTFRQIGIATGTAGLGALFQGLLANRATGRLAHVPAEVLAQGRPEVAGPRRPRGLPDALHRSAQRPLPHRRDHRVRRRGAVFRAHPRPRLHRLRAGRPGGVGARSRGGCGLTSRNRECVPLPDTPLP